MNTPAKLAAADAINAGPVANATGNNQAKSSSQ
jgi:hypothetical protein